LEFTKTILTQNVKTLESGTKYPVKQRHFQEELIYDLIYSVVKILYWHSHNMPKCKYIPLGYVIPTRPIDVSSVIKSTLVLISLLQSQLNAQDVKPLPDLYCFSSIPGKIKSFLASGIR